TQVVFSSFGVLAASQNEKFLRNLFGKGGSGVVAGGTDEAGMGGAAAVGEGPEEGYAPSTYP
ncbi:MAG: hypothetical protein Q8O76_00050, partial [Chloroflexota bacterium]|nr:hypothetical protein [Chloroflexota bacterium]